MSGLDNLRKRLEWQGGINQQDRINKGKALSLKGAIRMSYQSETAILPNGQEVKCLINPNKLKKDYDDKILSIPFEDIILNEEKQPTTLMGTKPIELKAGDVIEWKETHTYWIVYLREYTERSYYRYGIRRARYVVNVGKEKTPYRVYVRGPAETEMEWFKEKKTTFNGLNYTLVMTVTKTEETDMFFHRHTQVKFENKNWRVVAIDGISTEGVIDVYLDEYYSNELQDKSDEYKESLNIVEDKPEDLPYIEGDESLSPYGSGIYTVKNIDGGKWCVDTDKVVIMKQEELKCFLKVISGRSCNFILYYITPQGDKLEKKIKVGSF